MEKKLLPSYCLVNVQDGLENPHKVLRTITFKPFAVQSHCLHQNAQQRLLTTNKHTKQQSCPSRVLTYHTVNARTSKCIFRLNKGTIGLNTSRNHSSHDCDLWVTDMGCVRADRAYSDKAVNVCRPTGRTGDVFCTMGRPLVSLTWPAE